MKDHGTAMLTYQISQGHTIGATKTAFIKGMLKLKNSLIFRPMANILLNN